MKRDLSSGSSQAAINEWNEAFPPPEPDAAVNITRLLPLMQETLVYCASQAILVASGGHLDYDADSRIITYHLTVHDLDRDIFPLLNGVEEIWIMSKGGQES